jgi:hypothetical protein
MSEDCHDSTNTIETPRRCWLCFAILDQDEIQYCIICELEMLQDIMREEDSEK